MINVIIAFTLADARTIRDNFDQLPADVQSALREAKKTKWKQTTAGGKTYIILDAIMKIQWVLKAENRFPDAIVVRAWNYDGSQVGTTRVIDKDTGVISYTGTPARKGVSNSKLLSVMPDIENADGTTSPATILSDAFGHSWFGWGKRDYSL